MQLVFLTNIWNHYQGALGEALAEVLGESFRMILCDRLEADRRRLGWESEPSGHSWLLPPPPDSARLEQYAASVTAADVALLGAAPGWLQRRRAKTGKLTFIASERLAKEPLSLWRRARPRAFVSEVLLRRMAKRTNVHLLAIGADAATDARSLGLFQDRIWNWGYFAAVDDRPPMQRPRRLLRVLWAGRMLKWKRVDTIIRAAAQLQGEPGFGGVDLVGTGPELQQLRTMAQDLGIASRITFHDSQSPDGVRRRMRDADVCVLTSDRNEGWGVVANEAMAEGCVLLANTHAGASRVLVRDGTSGFWFEDGDVERLAELLRMFSRDRALLAKVGMNAWQEVHDFWSPRVAATRFRDLASSLQAGLVPPTYEAGPCGSANRLTVRYDERIERCRS